MDEILASIRRILAEDERAPAHAPRRARSSGDVLDLTEAIGDDGSVRHIPPVRLVAPEPVPPVPPDGRIEPAAPRPDTAAGETRLVSDAASDAVASAFARLTSLPRGDSDGGSMDAVVRETLRPLLQAWLDEHLPELVERLVRAEIARVVGTRPQAP
ncbi:MAG TPA: DUF2497 domain-containing protein [Stellaceae bacterium]|nr:DUF2497 domain-containing protein [Stellaceae bacterium]